MTSKVNYRSSLEARMAPVLERALFEYESSQIEYSVPSRYTPDFSRGPIHVEVKGWFRPGDRKKYKAIADTLGLRGQRLIFLLSHPEKKIDRGGKTTMAGWCEKHGIAWFDDPKKLVKWVKRYESDVV